MTRNSRVGCQAHFAKRPKTIFSNQTSPKNPERLAQCRSALEMQCFCNCMLSNLLLTRGVASRDLYLWLPRGTSQNAIFSNKQKQKMLIICQIDWREVGVAFELQCLRNCTLSSCLYASANNRRWRHYVFRSSIRPSGRCPSVRRDFNKTCHRYSSCDWTVLKRFSRSEIKGQGHRVTKCTFRRRN